MTGTSAKTVTRKRTLTASRFAPRGATRCTPGGAPLVDLASGDRYVIEELIGSGGFGGVYRARWRSATGRSIHRSASRRHGTRRAGTGKRTSARSSGNTRVPSR